MAVRRLHRRVGSSALLAVLAATIGSGVALPAAASGDPGLSSVVVSSTFPGMVAAPPGAGNGPLTAANLGLLGLSPSTASMTQAGINAGALSGYYRTWT